MKHALILHGWPQYRLDRYFLSRHLQNVGFNVIAPNMFSRNYTFTPANVLQDVLIRLNGAKLDLIVGISLGGLIAPHVVRHFPEAKLVFIGTGPRLKSKSKNFNLIVNLGRILLNLGVANLLLKLPDGILRIFYRWANPFTGDRSRIVKYEKDLNKNLRFIKSIRIQEEKEILRFVTTVDNTNLLREFKNEALIYSGENDQLMPKIRGIELNKLLVKSKLVVSSGSHFDTFKKEDLKTVDEFLK